MLARIFEIVEVMTLATSFTLALEPFLDRLRKRLGEALEARSFEGGLGAEASGRPRFPAFRSLSIYIRTRGTFRE